MNGNAFRIVLEHENNHASGPGTSGKFDLWAVPNPTFKPLELKPEAGRAIIDLGATYSSSSAWDDTWKNPRLDS
jgi:hypothetical protein